jgi:hypothetical protein
MNQIFNSIYLLMKYLASKIQKYKRISQNLTTVPELHIKFPWFLFFLVNDVCLFLCYIYYCYRNYTNNDNFFFKQSFCLLCFLYIFTYKSEYSITICDEKFDVCTNITVYQHSFSYFYTYYRYNSLFLSTF